jgi:hypothetical protein
MRIGALPGGIKRDLGLRLAIATCRSVVAQAPTEPELSEVMAHYL